MIRRHIEPWIRSIREVITNPRAASTRWQRTVRFAYDLGRSGARQLNDDNAPVMAAALSYRTLFALLPVMVVTTVVIQAMYGMDEFKELVRNVVDSFGLDEVQVGTTEDEFNSFNGVTTEPAPANDSPGAFAPPDSNEGQANRAEGGETSGGVAAGDDDAGGEAEDEEAADVSLGDWVVGMVDRAADLNLEALGWVGLAIVIYAAIALMVTIENIFNTIYRAPQGRSWTWRVPLYWFMLTLSPVVIGLTYYMDARLSEWISGVTTWQWLLQVGPTIWSFCAMWLLMIAVYMLVPNTSVEVRPAMIGGFVAAILIEIGRRTLGAYISNAFTVSQIYGSLGLVPVFMFWVYLMWIVVLFGLQVSAMLQLLGGRRMEEFEQQRPRTGIADPVAVLAVMLHVGEQFFRGRAARIGEIARATDLPEASVRTIADQLCEDGYLHRIDRIGGVALARPADQIRARDLVQLGYDMVEHHAEHEPAVLHRLREVQIQEAGGRSLADLVGGAGGGGAADGDGDSSRSASPADNSNR